MKTMRQPGSLMVPMAVIWGLVASSSSSRPPRFRRISRCSKVKTRSNSCTARVSPTPVY